jgi:carbon-monoxide dehydrogenase medium subunit
MWRSYRQPTSLDEALDLLDRHAGRARLVAGGTDLIVELSRRPPSDLTLIDLTAIPGLKSVREDNGVIRLGPLATHNDVIASPVCVARALPLAQACWEVGAPQLRTRATVAGNLVTASPANDTISALTALGAAVTLRSVSGQRTVPLAEFYLGARRTVLQPNEIVAEISFPALSEHQRGSFLKLGLRRAQAISVVHLALVLGFDGAAVSEARLALGSVAPTVVRAAAAEAYVVGKRLDPEVREEAGRLAADAATPIDDLRGSANYRRTTVANLVTHGLARIAAGTETAGWPARPVLLETTPAPAEAADASPRSPTRPFSGPIAATVNGRPRELPDSSRKTLLAALRDDLGLTGTKEGCAEGECGACTVWLNGQAVLACLVPAPQMHNATVTTIEGLADGAGSELHPVQRAFVEHGAVQCGYCIPGSIMAGAKLLDEQAAPDDAAIRVALSGNICRCTGYRKILAAVADAGRRR